MKKLLFILFMLTLLAVGTQVYAEDGCPAGQHYSFTTGLQCGCSNGEVYSSTTGLVCPTNTTPSITVLSPNGGETYKQGDTVSIKWNSQNISSVYLKLYKGGNIYYDPYLLPESTISLNPIQASNGYFNWLIPNSLPNGSDYSIKVATGDSGDLADNSDSNFTINSTTTPPSITVLSPNGGETYKAGDKIAVKWKSTEISADTKLEVNISNGVAGAVSGALFGFLAPDGTPNDGVEEFTVSSIWPAGSGYKFIVGKPYGNDLNNSAMEISDKSDGPFTIATPPASFCPGASSQVCNITNGIGLQSRTCDSSNGTWSAYSVCKVTSCNSGYKSSENSCVIIPVTSPSITVLSPNGGEMYLDEQPVAIKWKSANIPTNAPVNIVLAGYRDDGAMSMYTLLSQDVIINDGIETLNLYKIPTYSGINFGKHFKIEINYNGVVANDSSDNYFTINSSIDYGCSNGEVYSSTTGQKCPVELTCPPNMPNPFALCSDGKIEPATRDVNQCVTSWKCVTPKDNNGCSSGEGYSSTTGQKCPGNNAPVISGVSGPQSLIAGQTGTWTVKATSLNGGNLSYHVDWGDFESRCSAASNTCATINAEYTQQSAVFTHVYSQAGTYTPTFTVTSENTIRCITTPCPSNGGSATTSLSVKVGSSSIYPAGCNSTEGYSYTTGLACDGSQGNGIDGCLPGQNYSSTTGQACVRIDPPCSSSGVGCGLGNTSIRRTLRRGIKGDDVKILQLFLNLAADGSFGPQTQQKVMEWQAQNGLKVDGAFGIQSATKAGLAE